MLRKIVEKAFMVRIWLALVFILAVSLPFAVYTSPVWAATTADVTVNATPAYVAISCNVSAYDYGTVATSITSNTSTSYFGITNLSTVQTDQTISVTSANWTGGDGWGHDDTGTPGASIAALLANRGGTWGTGDIIVKNASPNFIYENCGALTDYDFGLGLWTPTSYTDGAEKSITVRISAAQG